MLNDVPVFHDRHAVCQFEGLILIVRHQNAGQTQLPLQATQPGAHVLAHTGIKGTKGLVQQQHARLYGQGACQGHTLPLPARQLVGIARTVVAQLHQLQQFGHTAGDDRRSRAQLARAHLQAKRYVVGDGHVPEQGIVLKHKTHLTIARAASCNVQAIEQHLATVTELKPGDDAQQGGLARARRAQQGAELAFGHQQIDVMKDRGLAKGLAQALHCNLHQSNCLNVT